MMNAMHARPMPSGLTTLLVLFPLLAATPAAGADFAWDPGHLERWLTNTGEFLPGSIMNYRQKDETIRKGIIRYLQDQSAN